MNLRGPELKMPEVKVPPFLADLYYDLRDRRLLPLIGLVVVAIVAVPFLLGDSPEVQPGPAAPESNASASADDGSTLTVVEATPGLRDYHKRLKGRTPTDPFVQQFTTPAGGGGAEDTASSGGPNAGSASATSGGGGGASTEVGPSPGSGSGSGSGSTPQPDSSGLHYFAFRPDVRFGLAGSDQLKDYEALDVGTRLPQKKPAALFLGVSDDGKRATFALSSEVVLVRGEGQCIGGAQNCELLSLKAGDAVSLLTGNPERTFRLSVTKIQWIEVDPPKPEKASSSSRRPRLDFSQSFSK